MDQILAVLDWLVHNAGGVIVAFGLMAATIKFLFGPRIRAWVQGILEPVRSEISDMKRENTEQHASNAGLVESIRTDFNERWTDHTELHHKLAEDIGTLKGGQAAIVAGAQQLPSWPAPPEAETG